MFGVATLELRHAEFINGEWVAGEVIQSIENKNQILYNRYIEYIQDNDFSVYRNTSGYAQSELWISEYWQEGPYVDPVGTLVGTFLEETFVDKTATTPAYWTFKRRWDPPADNVIRYIKAVGLEALSIVSLGSIFEQKGRNTSTGAPAQILDVTYRLYINDSAATFTCYPSAAKLLATAFNYGTDNRAWDTSAFPRDLYFVPWSTNNLSNKLPAYWYAGYNSVAAVRTTTGDKRSQEGVTYLQAQYQTLTSSVGHLFSSAFVGYAGYPTTYPVSIRKPGLTAVQNTFGRSPGNNLPYIDVDHLATGTGVVTVDDNNGWVNDTDFARKYRILITASGTGTTATYKLLRRDWTGNNGDSFKTSFPFGLQKVTATRISSGANTVHQSVDAKTYLPHGQAWGDTGDPGGVAPYPSLSSVNLFIQPYIYPEFITADTNGITICHVAKPWENVDVNSAIPLPVGDVRQIQHTADGTIYVACAVSGLWKIQRNLGTPEGSVTAITRVTASNAEDDTKCRGFQIKRSDGSFWAIFGREMCKSTDSGVTWTVYNESTTPQFKITGVTDNVDYATRIVHCTINPTHANNQFVISLASSYTDEDGGGLFAWWSEAGSASTTDASTAGSGVRALTYKLVGTRVVYCTTGGRWLFYHNSTSDENTGYRIYDGYKGTSYSFRSAVGYVDWRGDSYGGPSCGDGINAFFAPDGTEYVIGLAGVPGSSAQVTPGNPAGENVPGQLVARNINTMPLSGWNNSDWQHLLCVNTILEGNWVYFARRFVYIGNGMLVGIIGYNLVAVHVSGPYIDQGVSLGFWKQYGWNGSAWVEGNTNSRTVHTTRESLIDGLSVTFSDNGAGSYVFNEWYDTYVYNGILKDNATKFNFGVDTFKTATYPVSTFSLNGLPLTTVPAANVGAVTNEPITAINTMYYASNNETVESYGGTSTWLEPGMVGFNNGDGRYKTAVFSEFLAGDFKISFRVCQTHGTGSVLMLRQHSNTFNRANVISSSSPLNAYFELSRPGSNDVVRTAAIKNVAGTVLHSNAITDFNISDVWSIRRVSGTVTFERNGNVMYTSPGLVTANLQLVGQSFSTNRSLFKDMKVDYTINRRYLDIGNGTTTGRADVNFRKIIAEPNVRIKVNDISLNGIPATLIWDSYTPPAAGQVTVMEYSGRLWFNEADAGKTVTGNIMYVKNLNLTNAAPELDTRIRANVTVGTGENYYGNGPKFFIDNVESAQLNLTAGQTYLFDVSNATCNNYTLRFSVTPDGSHLGGVEYIDRTVSGTPGSANAFVQITAPANVTLYYYDPNRAGMGPEPTSDYINTYDDTFVITVSDPGSGNKFYIDGVAAPTINLKQGGRYKFDISASSNTGHPLRFSFAADGTHGSGTQIKTQTYTIGSPGTAGSYVVLGIPHGHDALYYYCGNHAGMGGTFNTARDKYWSAVALLSHCDGTVGGTGIAAVSNLSSTFTNITFRGNGQFQNDVPAKFGTTSVKLDGVDDDIYITTTTGAVWLSQFTFEFWVRPTVLMSGTDDILFSNENAGSVYLQPGRGSNLPAALVFPGGTYYTRRDTDTLFPVNQWTHVVLQRNSRGRLCLYVGGVMEIEVNNTSTLYNVNNGQPNGQNIIMGRHNNNNNDFTGYFDEIRYTLNFGRYSGQSFPVPAAPFKETST